MSRFNNIFSLQCKHPHGYTPIIYEDRKITPTLTAVRAAACLSCGKVVNVPLPLAQAPANAAPPNTPAGVHPMPSNGAAPNSAT